MKYARYLQICLIIAIFSFTQEQILNLTTHYFYKKIEKNNWQDLLDAQVSCPHSGVFKNFIIRKNTTHYWFEYQCYSSVSDSWDYGEAVIKQVTLKSTYDWKSFKKTDYISSLNDKEVSCTADYALNSFQLSLGNGLTRLCYCKGVKPSSVTTMTVETKKKAASRTTMDALFDVLVGRTDKENDVDVGFPLRGFKFVVESSSSSNPNVYFKYSYAILRNMKELRDSYKQRFEQLRNGNTQKN